ncbi:MAG: hypothetical protein EA368_01890 [Leptolyngbya sp. DLM2.Bin27]|nr:MAG: hypothetical protein EA368_01890 [Leptolyngbya sp. DLM2.Bin27]
MPMVLVSAPGAIANDFEACTRSLLEADIEAVAAARACGQALHPAALSRCTVDIINVTDALAEQALLACQSDRRPAELATCVSDIHQNLEVTNSTSVINNCRRSLLPTRYADCVIGVAQTAELTIADSMSSCIAAGYRPVDVAPTFIFSR